MKKRNFLKKAANSFAGRLLRRLCGEENGAVMMEYIVVGLLIAAAVVAISAFGQTITQMFASLGASVTGDHATATDMQDKAQASMKAGATASDTYVSTSHSKKSGITVNAWSEGGK